MTETAHADKTEKPAKPHPSAADPAFSTLTPLHPRLEEPTFNARKLLQLQRAVGNQAVLRMLQRQVAGTAAAALTDAQVQQALAWYAGQSQRYTPEIIQQIRGRVGRASATGALTAEDVEAIAQWQADNNLPPDGMAGTTTLAAMFPMGLSESENISAFAEGAGGLQSEWASLTPTQRLDRLELLINQRLDADGLPHVDLTMDQSTYHAGAFDYRDWHIPIAQSVLTGVNPGTASGSIFSTPMPEEVLEDVITTVYHEARHSEQWFRIAQMLAGRGLGASYIHQHLDIPIDIATAAVASPLAPGSMEALIAQGWYDSAYGSRSADREDTHRRLRHADADSDRRAEEFEEHPTDESWESMDSADRRRARAVEPYRALPEEADAFRTEGALRTEMLLED